MDGFGKFACARVAQRGVNEAQTVGIVQGILVGDAREGFVARVEQWAQRKARTVGVFGILQRVVGEVGGAALDAKVVLRRARRGVLRLGGRGKNQSGEERQARKQNA